MKEWIIEIVRSQGEIGIGLLMFLENIILPIPSEYIMPMAGYLSERGAINFWGAIFAGTVGSLLGLLVWYMVGRLISERRLREWIVRHGRWVALEQADFDRATQFFQRHGRSSVFFGRLIPLVRVLISVPAGLVRMPLRSFLIYSAMGSALWNILLGYAGVLLGRYFPQIQDYVGILTACVVLGAVAWYVWRVVKMGHESAAKTVQ